MSSLATEAATPAPTESELVAVTMPDPGTDAEARIVAWCVAAGDEVDEGDPMCVVSVDGHHAEVLSSSAGRVAELLVGVDARVYAGASLAELAPPEPERVEQGDGADPERVDQGDGADPEHEPTPALVTLDPLFDPDDAIMFEIVEPKIEIEYPAPPANGHHPARAAEVLSWINQLRVTVELEPAPVEETEGESEPAPTIRPPPAPGPLASFHSPAVCRLAGEHGIDLTHVTGTGKSGRIRREDVLTEAIGVRTSVKSGLKRPRTGIQSE